jgi:hypothetical protein
MNFVAKGRPSLNYTDFRSEHGALTTSNEHRIINIHEIQKIGNLLQMDRTPQV